VSAIVPSRLRPSAKAVVVKDGRVLANHHRPAGGQAEWFGFPGGGQRPGETLPDALRREVAEETGCVVEPIRLLWVRELIVALRPELPFDPADHAIEFMFESRLIDDRGVATAVDTDQVGTAWLSPDDLADRVFFPRALVATVAGFLRGGPPGPVYLGDVD
jgi:8-oxo-dGTP pyrophosphatase MutT (NUDIX family)